MFLLICKSNNRNAVVINLLTIFWKIEEWKNTGPASNKNPSLLEYDNNTL